MPRRIADQDTHCNFVFHGWLSSVRAYNLCEQVMGLRLAEIGLRVAGLEVLATLATSPGITQQALAAKAMRIQLEVVAVVVDGASPTDIATLHKVMSRAADQLEALRQTLKS